MKYLIKLLLLIMLLSQSAFAASDKYLVEDSLTKLAQTSLDAMFGENNFIVRVQVQMTDSQYSVKYTQESTPKRSKTKPKQEEVFLLPGVPALKNIAPDSLNKLPFDSITTLVEPKISRMLVFVLANKNYPRSQARKAESTIKQVLSMKEGRDIIKMEFKPFYEDPTKEPESITIVPGVQPLITPQNVLFLILIILLGVAIFIYIIYQKKLLEKEDGDSGGPSINVNPNLELPEGLGGSGGGSNMKINMNANIKYYFDFVTETNLNDFIFLIKTQNLKPDYISLILSFLAGNLAAKVIKGLDPKIQAQVTLMMVDQRLGSKIVLDKLEKKLKGDLECFVGGEAKVSTMVNSLSSSERKDISELSKSISPAGFKKIRPYMVLFDDLMLLEEKELQLVLSDVNLEQLAISLVDADQELFSVVMDGLTKGAKDMVNQYLELKSATVNQAEKEGAQDTIIKVVKQMDSKGKINLLDKLKQE
jgi:hypothetical protein